MRSSEAPVRKLTARLSALRLPLFLFGGSFRAVAWQSSGATTVVYMPTKTLSELVKRAREAGLDPQTPAVAIERATRADERIIPATIADLPARLGAEPPSGPLVVLIGRVFADYVATA